MIPFVFWLPWPLICFDIEYKTLLVGLFNTCLICSNWITTAHKYSRWISPLNYLQWESQIEFAFHFETIINLDFKHHGSNFIWNVINLILEYLLYLHLPPSSSRIQFHYSPLRIAERWTITWKRSGRNERGSCSVPTKGVLRLRFTDYVVEH